MPDTRIGISGWRYAPWRGTFYPKDLPQRLELNYAASKLNSVEINGTFYSLQRPEYFRDWAAAVPEDFVFSIKGGRYITHLRRLKDVRTPLANFFASGVLVLGRKMGPILWQFPPQFPLNIDRFDEFFALLPRSTRAAAKLAGEADDFLKPRSYLEVDADRPIRHAVEIRHESFVTPDFVKLCRRHNVAIVLADTAGKWPMIDEATSDFAYARLHGGKVLYVSGYTEKALDTWAEKFRKHRDAGRDVFVYFDNDVKVRAPFDAMGLARRLGLKVDEAAAKHPANLKKVERATMPRTSWPGIGPRKKAVKEVPKTKTKIPAQKKPGAKRAKARVR
jgi:uncharacterized protein YecE (DUF72 family)